METDKVEREEQGYCDKTNVEWESSAPDGFRAEFPAFQLEDELFVEGGE